MNKKLQDTIRNECSEVVDKSVSFLNDLRSEVVLVSGGTGFVGTWIAELISYLNDNHSFKTKLILLAKNVNDFDSKASHLSRRQDVTLIENDVRNLMDIPETVTYIVHAAANPDNRQHSSDPIRTMEVISKGTEAVLSAASRLGNIKKILNISSGQVYGPQPYALEQIPETYLGGPLCDSIVSVYPEAKRYGETLCLAYRNQFKLPIVTARPFAFIGPYQLLDKPWAINNFMRDSLLGGTIHIHGNDNTVRSYMYASDMAFWFLRILAAGKIGAAYNVGSSKGITLLDLAKKIAAKYPNKIDIIHDMPPNRIADKSRFVPDTSSAEQSLNLSVSVEMDEAIKRTINWYIELGDRN
jgi:dTDP-glucose 4,6-dehydratase